jgi:Tfp pilus assembly protein PilN
MIKINLLHSVTERHSGAAVSVERQVSSPATRLIIMALAVGFLTALFIGWDIIGTQMQKTTAEQQLAEQKQIASELEAVMKEQKELEAKIQNIDTRIEAIKKLRDSQAGPSAVLEAVNERIRMTPGLYLESVEQAGEQVTIKGNSPDESAVTQFGRSLEFSGGLFTNLNIETQRKEIQDQTASVSVQGQDAAKKEIVNFVIRTAYTPSKAGASKDATTASATAPKPQGDNQAANPAAPPQVAKN